MEAFRLHALFKNIPPFSLQKLLHFSSSSAANPSARRFVSDDLSADGSSIYRHTLKFQCPTTIKWCDRFHNSVSFIGSVDRPLERRYTINGYLYVYTVLHVKPFREARRDVRIFLQMWDRMAEISFKHLKQNDLIHVSGHLGFYTKADDNGQPRPYHKVIVKELNYVTQFGQPPTYKKIENLESEGGTGLIKPKSRLYLWQVFFYNPDEWWDNRKRKKKPSQPDFEHKHTGEALWLHKGDPVWVRKQLQLHDSRMAELDQVRPTGSRAVSPMQL